MDNERIARKLVKTAKQLIASDVERTYKKESSAYELRWYVPLHHGDKDEVDKAFKDIEQVSESESSELEAWFNRFSFGVPPRVIYNKKSGQLEVFVTLIVKEDDLEEGGFQKIFEWDKGGI